MNRQRFVLPLPDASMQPRIFYKSYRGTKEQNLTRMTKPSHDSAKIGSVRLERQQKSILTLEL